MGRRILGFILIIVAIILTLAIVGRLSELASVIIHFFMVFSGKLSVDQVGFALGQMLVWVIHFIFTVLAWKYGIRFIRKISN